MTGLDSIRRGRLPAWALAIVVAVVLATAGEAVARDHVPLRGYDTGVWGEGTHDCGLLFPVYVDSEGTASHLGRYAYASTECVDFGTSRFAGSFEIVAADGSSLRGTYAGSFTVVDDVIHYEQENALAAGDGRFAGASGGFHVSGLASTTDFSATQVLDGFVSSVGSKK